jgi:hypothetical protein
MDTTAQMTRVPRRALALVRSATRGERRCTSMQIVR